MPSNEAASADRPPAPFPSPSAACKPPAVCTSSVRENPTTRCRLPSQAAGELAGSRILSET